MQVAATWYLCDQHEPCAPFLLDLACPDSPTTAELRDAVAAYYVTERADDFDDLIPRDVVVRREEYFGDVSARPANDDDPVLFLGLPKSAKAARDGLLA